MPDAPRTPSLTRLTLSMCALVAITVILYTNSLHAPFIFDDLPRIVDNESIRALWPIDGWLHDSRRPVVSLTLALNHALDGTNPAGYHVFNIAIHAMNAVLFFMLLRTAGKAERLPAWLRDRRETLALAAALLWAAHPLQTQAVTYTIQRGESLMALWYTLVLLATANTSLTENKRTRTIWIITAIAASALGMGTKGVMVTAPIAALLLDRTLFAGTFLGAIKRQWALYAGLALSWSVLAALGIVQQTFTPESVTGTARTVGFGFESATPMTYLLTQAQVIPHYLRLAVWPTNLCFDYRWPFVTDTGNAILPGLFTLILVGVSAWGLIKARWWGVACTIFFLILAPT